MANLQNYGHLRGLATSYAQDPAQRMWGAGVGRPEGPEIGRGRNILGRCGGPGCPGGRLRAALLIEAIFEAPTFATRWPLRFVGTCETPGSS